MKIIRAISFGAVLALALSTTHAYGNASFALGDAVNYAVLYEGTGGHNFHLSGGGSTITGNVGIGGTGKAGLSGPGTITGNLDFSAANTGQFSDSGVPISGSVNYSVSAVTSALNSVNTLSTQFAGDAGSAPTVTENNNTQTIKVGGGVGEIGHFDSLRDAYVVNLTDQNFNNGTVLTIQGNGSGNELVVFDVANNASFDGTIKLTGGLTSSQVLFNVTGTGHSLSFSGNFSGTGNTVSGIFLDPNGSISINNAEIDGQLLGGDSQDLQFVSNAHIIYNTPPSEVADGGSSAVLFGGVLGLLVTAKRKYLS
jgi:hypothetical protein